MIAHASFPQSQPIQAPFHDLASIAKKLKVSKRSLLRWARNGMPTYQACPRGKVLVREDEVLDFLSRHRNKGAHLDALVHEVLQDLDLSHRKGRK